MLWCVAGPESSVGSGASSSSSTQYSFEQSMKAPVVSVLKLADANFHLPVAGVVPLKCARGDLHTFAFTSGQIGWCRVWGRIWRP